MKVDLEAVAATFNEVGAASPAFKSLFGLVVGTFAGDAVTQDTMRKRYAEAFQRAEDAHEDGQAI